MHVPHLGSRGPFIFIMPFCLEITFAVKDEGNQMLEGRLEVMHHVERHLVAAETVESSVVLKFH